MQELESTTGPQAESPFAEVQTPRLSILHLMLWTLCSAGHLSLMRAVHAHQGNMGVQVVTIQNASTVIHCIATGAALMGAFVLVHTRVRGGPPLLRQPGHWLVFVHATFFLIYLPTLLSLLLLKNSVIGVMSFGIYLAATYLFLTISYGLAAYYNGVRRWRAIFVAMAVVALLQGGGYFATALPVTSSYSWYRTFLAAHTLGHLLVAVAIVVASTVDFAAVRRYDWLHWTGVATHLAACSTLVLRMIGEWFVR